MEEKDKTKYVHVYNAETGEQTQREKTSEEIADDEANIANAPALPSAE